MYPELLGRPVIVRFKKLKSEGNLIHFDSKKLILLKFDTKTVEIILKYDSLEPNLYCGESDVDHIAIFKQLCGMNDTDDGQDDGAKVRKRVKSR